MGKRTRKRPDGEGDGPGAGRPAKPTSDGRLSDVVALAEEADCLYHLLRWTVMRGAPPRPQDWAADDQWPHPEAVSQIFGGWEKFLAQGGLTDSPLLARVGELESRERDMEARERALAKEQERAHDLRRQVEVARRRREEADRERGEAEGRLTRAEGRANSAEERAARAEGALAEHRAESGEAGAARGAGDEATRAAHEAALAELESVRAHREQLLGEVEELREAAERDRRAVAELSALLGEREGEGPADGGAGAPTGVDATGDAPATVLDAVRRARAEADHLRFTDAAEESAADSPYRRPADLLEALRRLDRVAGLYVQEEGFGASLSQAARDLGLNWRAGVSELARSRKPHHYAVSHEGARLELGPHVAVGSGSGAGYVARIYLAVEDGSGPLPRGLYVGHVGRHLPDTTT